MAGFADLDQVALGLVLVYVDMWAGVAPVHRATGFAVGRPLPYMRRCWILPDRDVYGIQRPDIFWRMVASHGRPTSWQVYTCGRPQGGPWPFWPWTGDLGGFSFNCSVCGLDGELREEVGGFLSLRHRSFCVWSLTHAGPRR